MDDVDDDDNNDDDYNIRGRHVIQSVEKSKWQKNRIQKAKKKTPKNEKWTMNLFREILAYTKNNKGRIRIEKIKYRNAMTWH